MTWMQELCETGIAVVFLGVVQGSLLSSPGLVLLFCLFLAVLKGL